MRQAMPGKSIGMKNVWPSGRPMEKDMKNVTICAWLQKPFGFNELAGALQAAMADWMLSAQDKEVPMEQTG